MLAGRAADARAIAGWTPPRLPIGGGSLIKRGLREGPVVSKTLRRIEERWIAAGFPEGQGFDSIVADEVRESLR